ncbi:CRISPR-associated CARF protein Csx1 [Thermosediminibacter litoriperuensis]|uniref:CRISPR-associated protein Csx1 n=1 Tax=Thermosediminibacter litoriperuensis TaxID=291989 RepID=A0A5S5ATJ5_9FIRM|nr:CRISPR-associated CARF protein Csx1 [Thermosediminibacter litoriperuensis]TYP55428.1 CRISPR-associated protein Csx1 [Thermosediminibacter litoriperuensis]
MNSLIYQIGRLDRNIIKKQKFRIEGKTRFKQLSSFALKEHLKENGEQAKVILVYPISLPFNRTLENANFGDFSRSLKAVSKNPKEEYLSNPKNFFSNMPYSSEVDDFFVIHSIGEYAGINFEGKFNDIVFEIALDMIERYNEEIERIYVDISSGLNIYVSALLEAVRFFSTWAMLKNWLPEAKRPEIWITFSDPILDNDAAEYQLHREKLEFKAFFASPINKEDINNVAKKIYEDDRSKKRKLSSLLENFLVIFSAIKNNIPLAVYLFGYDNREVIDETSRTLIEDMKKKFYDSYAASPNLDKNTYSKGLLSLAFYSGIAEVFWHYQIKNYDEDDGIDLDELKRIFDDLYSLFSLKPNNVFLGNEISNTKRIMEKINIEDSTWHLLIKFHNKEYEGRTPDKRNFFAHSGLEGLVTEMKKEKDNFFVRYTREYTDKSGNKKSVKNLIREWLKEEA